MRNVAFMGPMWERLGWKALVDAEVPPRSRGQLPGLMPNFQTPLWAIVLLGTLSLTNARSIVRSMWRLVLNWLDVVTAEYPQQRQDPHLRVTHSSLRRIFHTHTLRSRSHHFDFLSSFRISPISFCLSFVTSVFLTSKVTLDPSYLFSRPATKEKEHINSSSVPQNQHV